MFLGVLYFILQWRWWDLNLRSYIICQNLQSLYQTSELFVYHFYLLALIAVSNQHEHSGKWQIWGCKLQLFKMMFFINIMFWWLNKIIEVVICVMMSLRIFLILLKNYFIHLSNVEFMMKFFKTGGIKFKLQDGSVHMFSEVTYVL